MKPQEEEQQKQESNKKSTRSQLIFESCDRVYGKSSPAGECTDGSMEACLHFNGYYEALEDDSSHPSK
jgi:hypothetical protein